MFTPPALTLSSSSNAKALTEKDVAEACMQTGYKFSPRLHINLFGNAWGT